MDLNETQKKMVFKFWKTHGGSILKLLEKPTANRNNGIQNIDWEIHLTAHSRHQSGIQKQGATVLMNTKNGDKIFFEMSKGDVNQILNKIDATL